MQERFEYLINCYSFSIKKGQAASFLIHAGMVSQFSKQQTNWLILSFNRFATSDSRGNQCKNLKKIRASKRTKASTGLFKNSVTKLGEERVQPKLIPMLKGSQEKSYLCRQGGEGQEDKNTQVHADVIFKQPLFRKTKHLCIDHLQKLMETGLNSLQPSTNFYFKIFSCHQSTAQKSNKFFHSPRLTNIDSPLIC